MVTSPKLLNEAYSTLANSERRSEYNNSINIDNAGFVVKNNMLWHRSKNYQSPYNKPAGKTEDLKKLGI